MADLKTYSGINDVDIKSVSGLPANDTKTILGSLLKQIPDGAITNKSETKYLVTKDSEKYITIKTA